MDHFEIWDLVSGNLLGVYETEAEALSWIHRYLLDEGSEYVEELALDTLDATGKRLQIAEGNKLVDLALTQAPAA